MAEPEWILDEAVLAAHQRQLAEHGGADGLRDAALLESALAKPKNLYHYNDPKPSIAEMAAAYAYGIARNHAFVDGNKRIALAVCDTFLTLNGVELVAPPAEVYQIFMQLAAGELSEKELAQWIDEHID